MLLPYERPRCASAGSTIHLHCSSTAATAVETEGALDGVACTELSFDKKRLEPSSNNKSDCFAVLCPCTLNIPRACYGFKEAGDV